MRMQHVNRRKHTAFSCQCSLPLLFSDTPLPGLRHVTWNTKMHQCSFGIPCWTLILFVDFDPIVIACWSLKVEGISQDPSTLQDRLDQLNENIGQDLPSMESIQVRQLDNRLGNQLPFKNSTFDFIVVRLSLLISMLLLLSCLFVSLFYFVLPMFVWSCAIKSKVACSVGFWGVDGPQLRGPEAKRPSADRGRETPAAREAQVKVANGKALWWLTLLAKLLTIKWFKCLYGWCLIGFDVQSSLVSSIDNDLKEMIWNISQFNPMHWGVTSFRWCKQPGKPWWTWKLKSTMFALNFKPCINASSFGCTM